MFVWLQVDGPLTNVCVWVGGGGGGGGWTYKRNFTVLIDININIINIIINMNTNDLYVKVNTRFCMGASVSAVSFMVLPLVAVWTTTSIRKHWWMKVNNIQWKKPLLNGHLRDLPKCPLNRGCKNCAMFVNENAWRLLCTVVKFHVVKETLYFVQDF